MRKGRAFSRRAGAVSIGVVCLCLLAGMISLAQVLTVGTTQAASVANKYDWKPLKIGGGGWVIGLVISPKKPGVMYARTDVGGAYRWNANKQTWSQIILSDNVPGVTPGDYSVESIAVSAKNDQLVYMAVGMTYSSGDDNGRILKSTDGGRSWTDSGRRWYMAGNGDNRQGAERLAIDPNNDNIVYFGSRTEGLWVSTDGDKTWTEISTSLVPVGNSGGTPSGVKWVLFDPSAGTLNGATKRIYAGVAGEGVYRSDDAGDSWKQVLTTSDVPYDEALASDGTLYATMVGAGSVQKYNPTTSTWTNISPNSGEGCYSIALDPFNNQRLFVGGCGMRNGHFWRSTDGGTNWDTLNVSLTSPTIPWITQTDETGWLSTGRIVFDPFVQNQLWFAEGTGVYEATNLSDSTINWTSQTVGIEEMVANDVIAPPGGKPITVVEDRNGFYHANPDTFPTQPILTSKFSDGTSLDYSGGNPSFVVAASSDTRNINPSQSGYSTDGGQTWTEFSGMGNYSDLYGGNIAVSATNTSTIVWLPTNNKLPYVTTDQGKTWTQLTFFQNVKTLHTMIWWASKKALDSDKVNGNFYIYSTDNGGEFFRSSNNGQTWVQTASAPPSTNNDAHVFGQIRAVPGNAGDIWASVAQGGFWHSTNAGDSWTQITALQQARSFGYGIPMNGSSYPTIFVDGQINNEWGIWRSTDEGANWDLVSQYPLNIADQVNTVNGDMNIAGRVYVGFAGNGFAYGDTNETGSSSPTPTQAGTGSTVTLNPIADQDNYYTHNGTETTLDASIYQYMYLKFDLSSVKGSVSSAHFQIYRPDVNEGSITLTAYQVSDNSWTEGSSTLPSPGSQITTVSSSSVGYVDFDITSYVQSALSGGNTTLSLAINASCSQWQDFYSRENGSNEPQLLITAG